MCGIFITNKPYNHSMTHRGIKTYEVPITESLTVVHEHLPIQSVISDNPIIETPNFIVLFNGEIFNDEYPNDLELLRDRFSAPLEAVDIIQDLYKEDGFYSLIVYDKKSDLIYAFSDPLGKKQLYYSSHGIGSEIKALKEDSSTLDPHYLSHVIKFGYNINDDTPYKEIKRILPNTLYVFDSSFHIKKTLKEMYTFKPNYQLDFYACLEKSVTNRLKSNVDIGLLLSGGLDSSIIHHHIKQNFKKNLSVYCINNQNDLNYACLLEPTLKVVSLEMNPEALKAMEVPVDLGSVYPQFDLFSKIKETVILTGDGADEVFGGYSRIRQYDSQYSDIFDELPYYHNVRIDRLSMRFTKEVRCPFMNLSIIEHGMALSWESRQDKKWLRECYLPYLPKEIVYRPKEPLKNDFIRVENKIEYRKNLVTKWLSFKKS